MPELIGLSVEETKKTLKDLGLEVEINGVEEKEETEDMIVTEQLPKKGIKVNSGTKVIIYVK